MARIDSLAATVSNACQKRDYIQTRKNLVALRNLRPLAQRYPSTLSAYCSALYDTISGFQSVAFSTGEQTHEARRYALEAVLEEFAASDDIPLRDRMKLGALVSLNGRNDTADMPLTQWRDLRRQVATIQLSLRQELQQHIDPSFDPKKYRVILDNSIVVFDDPKMQAEFDQQRRERAKLMAARSAYSTDQHWYRNALSDLESRARLNLAYIYTVQPRDTDELKGLLKKYHVDTAPLGQAILARVEAEL